MAKIPPELVLDGLLVQSTPRKSCMRAWVRSPLFALFLPIKDFSSEFLSRVVNEVPVLAFHSGVLRLEVQV